MKSFKEHIRIEEIKKALHKPQIDFSCLKATDEEIREHHKKLCKKIEDEHIDMIPMADEMYRYFFETPQAMNEAKFDYLKNDEFIRKIIVKYELDFGRDILKIEYNNGVGIYIVIQDDAKIEKMIDTDMRLYGNFLSFKSKKGFKTFLFFEPLVQANVNDIVFKQEYIYHYTQSNRVESILKNGLEPRNERKSYFYQQRVYFTLFEDIELLRNLRKDMIKNGLSTDNNFSVLRIKTKELKELADLNFYFDAFVENGVFTSSGISSKYVEKYKEYEFDEQNEPKLLK